MKKWIFYIFVGFLLIAFYFFNPSPSENYLAKIAISITITMFIVGVLRIFFKIENSRIRLRQKHERQRNAYGRSRQDFVHWIYMVSSLILLYFIVISFSYAFNLTFLSILFSSSTRLYYHIGIVLFLLYQFGIYWYKYFQSRKLQTSFGLIKVISDVASQTFSYNSVQYPKTEEVFNLLNQDEYLDLLHKLLILPEQMTKKLRYPYEDFKTSWIYLPNFKGNYMKCVDYTPECEEYKKEFLRRPKIMNSNYIHLWKKYFQEYILRYSEAKKSKRENVRKRYLERISKVSSMQGTLYAKGEIHNSKMLQVDCDVYDLSLLKDIKEDRKKYNEYLFKSLLSVPLYYMKHRIGILNIFSTEYYTFTQQDELFIEMLALHLGHFIGYGLEKDYFNLGNFNTYKKLLFERKHDAMK